MDKLKSLLRDSDPLLKPLIIGQHQFPGIWAEMMPMELLQFQFPAERRATCMSCPKSCYEGYRPDYRCCTYHPRIANFLLGLGSETKEGDAAIDRLLDLGMLTPEGMYSTPGQWIDFLDDQKNQKFGKSKKVLCPMLNPSNGFCDVHAFRNSVCSTFFCHSDHGLTGESFWMQVQTLGSQIELVLAQWSLRQLGFDVDRYIAAFDTLSKNIDAVSTQTGWTEEALDLLWGDWRGREKELMRASAALIVENRAKLWEIANSNAILESRLFDDAMDTLVPADLEAHVEGKNEDMEGEGDEVILDPEDTFYEAIEAHDLLWYQPKGHYHLSPNLTFKHNERKGKQGRYHAKKPYFIEYRFKPDEAPQWRLDCSLHERKFLEQFRLARTLKEALKSEAGRKLPNAQVFLSEALNRRMIWPLRNAE